MDITVCITSYNQRDFLIEAIESVMAQTLRPAEIVIVDDASTDGSAAVIHDYATRFPGLIRAILKERNRGVVDTFNLGLEVAGGDFISFLAGDDRWLPAKLEMEAGCLSEPDHPDGVFSDYYFTDPGGERAYLWAGEQRPPQGDILPQLLVRDFPRRALFRSELADLRMWRQVGRFDSSFNLYEDWDMRIRLATRLRYAYVHEPLSDYRRHGAGQSRASIDLHLSATDHIERKYVDLLRSLEPTHGPYLRRRLASWRAHLWRTSAREVALRRPPGFRVEALNRFRRSLTYEPMPDIRLLWYLLRPDPGA
jgi:glycosyltransferase involved in cell wall biosynthesis